MWDEDHTIRRLRLPSDAGLNTRSRVGNSTSKAASETPEPEVRPHPEVGSEAPEFCLPADDGSTVCLKDLRGKTVVLYFYPKDSTPGCTAEACGFRDREAALAAQDAVVLGVSRDSVASHARFKKRKELNFPLLSDPAAEAISAYGAWGEKKFMGRTFNGIIRCTVIIDPEGRVAKVYGKVKAKAHPAEVLEDLEARS